MRRTYVAIAVLLLSMAGALAALSRDADFPHEKHAQLFPLCTGCHEGIEENDRARFFPGRALCQNCHNGTEQKHVDWRGPTTYASNLKFSHETHQSKEPLECSACHNRAGQSRMTVVRTLPNQCFACHAHQARDHFVNARCEQCHVPLARTAFLASRVDSLPKPPSHDAPDFLQRAHGELSKTAQALCAVCHTRERCAACHVDARRTEVQAFEPAGAQLRLPRFTARYFLPESHRSAEWIERHGQAASTDITKCSACHTRESCAACHATNQPKPVRALPRIATVTAPGVKATRRAPPTHKTPFFEQEHGTLAAASRQKCMGCHTRPQCENCHNAAASGRSASVPATSAQAKTAQLKASTSAGQDSSRGPHRMRRLRAAYHPNNFLERHASAAYNRNLECANCHETSRFCRSCHEQQGMGTSGRLQPGFHDAQPLWLLNHGKPARQGMESCASCHKQTDCMQCHSSLGSFRVNPHGPSFDAARVQSKNQKLCFACHLTDPLQRNRQ
jgi:hypothetical protein